MNVMRVWLIPWAGALVFASALFLAHVRYENRILFMQLQELYLQEIHLEEDWARLQLAYAELANPARLEPLAREQLHMMAPQSNDIVFIHPSPSPK